MNEQIRPKIVGNVYKAGWVRGTFGGTVYDPKEIAPTLLNMSAGGGRVPMIYEQPTQTNPSCDPIQQ